MTIDDVKHYEPCEEAWEWLTENNETMEEAWDTCQRGDWMEWLLVHMDTPKYFPITSEVRRKLYTGFVIHTFKITMYRFANDIRTAIPNPFTVDEEDGHR